MSLLTIFSKYHVEAMSNGQLKCMCPFRKNHTGGGSGQGLESFRLSPEINAYHCFAGETRVITDKGSFPIKDLSGSEHNLLTKGGKWIKAPIKSFGKQELVQINLIRDGIEKTIFATSMHRWFITRIKSEVRTFELQAGDYLHTTIPNKRTNWKLDPKGIQHGIVFGDGSLNKRPVNQNGTLPPTYGFVNLHGEKIQLKKYFTRQQNKGVKYRDSGETYHRIFGGSEFSNYKKLPDISNTEEYLLGFLSGYIATDGCVSEQGLVMLNSSNKRTLEKIRSICHKLGIAVHPVVSQERLGYGTEMSTVYRIMFISDTFSDKLLLKESNKQRFRVQKYSRLRWRVVSINETNRNEKVYCAEVPDTHSFVLEDYILTGNCFSCHAKGNLINLLTSDMFDIPFFEALEYVRLTEYKKEIKDTINGSDSEYFIDFNRPPKQFLDRGFSKELLRYFRVGMTQQKNVAGIPHYNYKNELMGIKYRNLEEKNFWYSEGYVKENGLYNFNPKAPYMVVCEGESDSWRAHSWGYFACASLGSSLSEKQAEMLSKIPKVYLAYNTDMPGVRCTDGAYKLLNRYTDVEILNLPANDIDDCSFRQFKYAFNNPVNYATFKLLTGI